MRRLCYLSALILFLVSPAFGDPLDPGRFVLDDGSFDPELVEVAFSYDGVAAYTLQARGAEAFQVWESLYSLRNVTGYLPIILGDVEYAEESLSILTEQQEFMRRLADEGYSDVDLETWRRERRRDYREYYSFIRGDWPRRRPATPSDIVLFATYDHFEGAHYERVVIVLIPTLDLAQLPLALAYGGWNDCPDPYVQSATFAEWYAEFGAVPVAMTFDTVEFIVPEPVATRQAAMKLAEEQFLYCADIVTQGTQTLEELAWILMNSPLWFFWWD